MATDYTQFQPKVKNSDNVLVGVAQVRVGKPSVRDAETAVVGPAQAVHQSNLITDATDGVTKVVRPTNVANTGVSTDMASSGAYTGPLDGCFIIRYNGTNFDIFGPDGYMDAGVTEVSINGGYAMKLEGAVASGVTVTATFTGLVDKDTFVVPVWSADAMNKTQTGIISPYSMFKGSNESVGGLESASFDPKVDDMATLESGFPSEVVDRIVTKTSVTVKFEAQEYTNANVKYLKDLVSKMINEATTAALPVEVVMRTRGNQLISFWIPNSIVEDAPEYAPKNDFSALGWSLAGSKLSEANGASATYNAWLRNAWLYRELEYVH